MWPFRPNVEKMAKKGNVVGLIRAVGNQNLDVRRAAAEALARVRGDRASSALCDALANALESNNIVVSIEVARALGHVGGDRAASALCDALEDENTHVCVAAAQALGRVGGARAVSALCHVLGGRNTEVCVAAAEALGRIGDVQAVGSLATQMSDVRGENRQSRRAAARALEKIGVPKDPIVQAWSAVTEEDWATAASLGAAAVEPLCAALRDRAYDGRARSAAAQALGTIGDPRAVDPLLAQLVDVASFAKERMTRARRNMRWASRDRMALIGPGDMSALEARAIEDEREDLEMGWEAARALAKIGGAAVERLRVLLAHSDGTVREWAAFCLGEIEDARSTDSLVPLLEDAEWNVRERAAEALQRLGWQPDTARLRVLHALPLLRADDLVAEGEVAVLPVISALGSSNHLRMAAEVLGRIKDPRAVWPLIEVFDRSDVGVEEVVAAAEALGDLADPRARGVLEIAYRHSSSPQVRQAARNALDILSDAPCGPGPLADPELVGAWGRVFCFATLVAADAYFTYVIRLAQMEEPPRSIEIGLVTLKPGFWLNEGAA